MNFKLLCVIVSFIFWIGAAKCQCQGNSLGARSAGLAGIASVSEDVWALSNNPAGLSRIMRLGIGANLEQGFFMKELGRYAIGLTFPAGIGCFGINSISMGYLEYIEQMISMGYGRMFGQSLLTGLSLVYVYQKASNQVVPLHQLSYQLGVIILVSDKVSLGFSAFNPFDLYWKSQQYAALPGIIRLGISYRHSPILILMAEFEKDLNFTPSVKAGFELIQKDIFYIRGGIRVFPATFTFGAGFRKSRYMMDISSSYHQYLGFTPQLSFQYDLK